jgi:predicted acyltransferase
MKRTANSTPVSKIQKIIIFIFPICFLFIMQRSSFLLYKIGTVVLLFNAIFQIIFGNINDEATTQVMIKGFIKNALIVLCVFVIGILIAPSLVQLGRG